MAKIQIGIRIDNATNELLRDIALRESRSIGAQVGVIVRDYAARHSPQPASITNRSPAVEDAQAGQEVGT